MPENGQNFTFSHIRHENKLSVTMLCKPASVIHSAILLSLVGFAFGAQRTKTSSAQADAENEIFNQREKPSTKSDQQQTSKLSVDSSDGLSDLELRVSELSFTGDEYKAEIPENSMGRVYVNPADPRYANIKAIVFWSKNGKSQLLC